MAADKEVLHVVLFALAWNMEIGQMVQVDWLE